MTLATGAAGVQGRVISATEGAPLPASLRVHLVPAEREASDDVLRFAETAIQGDGAFTFKNIPPGRYWLLAKPAAGGESNERVYHPMAWESDGRATLRREAESENVTIELQPCQRVTNHQLRYTPKSKSTP